MKGQPLSRTTVHFVPLLIPLLLLAQVPGNPPAPAAQPPTQTIKVTTRLVQINVLVHDHHGNPVGDLTKNDFEVTDQGKVQTISLFTVDTIAPAGGRASGQPSAPAMAPNVVTNRPERQGNAPTSVTVLLLDLYNTKITDQMATRRQIVRFLRQIRPEDRVALYVLRGSGFTVVHDFTDNSESLLTALAKVVPGFSHELDASDFDAANTGNDNMDSFIDGANLAMSNFFTRNRILNTCTAFKTLADHLAGLPGRKNLVWVSGGFPISFGYGDPADQADQGRIASVAAQDRELFADYIEEASTAMNTANVAVYPVDARGLLGLPMADASKNVKVDPRTHSIPKQMMTVDQRNMDTMHYIADLTGGRAFMNRNDIDGAIREAIDDSSVTYTLGYYASEENWDNKFHKIKVKVDRSGVTVRTKKGYLAQEQAPPTSVKLDEILHDAVWSPLDSTAIALSAHLDTSPTPNAKRLIFQVDGSEIQFHPEADKYVDSLDIVFVQQAKRGAMIANSKKTVNIKATAAQLETLRRNGLSAGEDLSVNPDTQAVRIIVLDRNSGSTGSVTVPIASAK
jgi:VWFA-related protein